MKWCKKHLFLSVLPLVFRTSFRLLADLISKNIIVNLSNELSIQYVTAVVKFRQFNFTWFLTNSASSGTILSRRWLKIHEKEFVFFTEIFQEI